MRPLSKIGVSGELRYLGSPVAEDPPAEGDHPAAGVADRDHQPPAEAVVGSRRRRVWISMPVSTSLSSPRWASARLSAVRLSGARPMPKRSTAAESMPRFADSRGPRPVDAGSCSANHFCTSRHDVGQRGGALGLLAGAGVGGRHLHPRLGRKLLDRVHERQPAGIGQEADRIAMRAAAEAMVEALVVVDGEARRLLVVERAARLELAPRADELHGRGDDGRQQGAGAQFVEEGGERVMALAFDARFRSAAKGCAEGLRSS